MYYSLKVKLTILGHILPICQEVRRLDHPHVCMCGTELGP